MILRFGKYMPSASETQNAPINYQYFGCVARYRAINDSKHLISMASQRRICKCLQTGSARLIFGVGDIRYIRKHIFDGAHFFSHFFLLFK